MKILFVIGIVAAIIAFIGVRQMDNQSDDGSSMSGRLWVIAVVVLFIVVNILAMKDCSKNSGSSNHIEYRHSD